MDTYWYASAALGREQATIDPRLALIAAAIYIGSIMLLVVSEAVYEWVNSRRSHVDVARSLGSWPSLMSISSLTPRELVLMLDHLAEVGELYAEPEVCDALAAEVRARLRQLECQPVGIEAGRW